MRRPPARQCPHVLSARWLAATIGIALWLVGSPPTPASEIRVPADEPTIVAAASVATENDTILVSPGTYVEDVLLPNNVTLRGEGDPASVVLEGAGSSSVLHCETTGSMTRVENVTIRDGTGLLESTERIGGGVLVRGGFLTLKNVVVESCQADIGGGIFLEDAELVWEGGALSGNDADLGGGVFARRGTARLSRVEVRDNGAFRGGGLFGTGINLLSLDQSLWTGNAASDRGGAVYLETTAATVGDCRFEANGATAGGGWYIGEGSIVNATRTTFLRNTAVVQGGALLVTCEGPAGDGCSQVRLTQSDLIANDAPAGGACMAGGASLLEIESSVVAGNTSAPRCDDPRATLSIACSALYGNGTELPNACGESIADTLATDPYLCDLGGGDLTRCANSPLLHQAPCGLDHLGATAESCAPCGVTQTLRTSWGKVKARYR